MATFNDKYNEEITELMARNPKTYGKMIKSRGFKGRYPDRSYLFTYIMESTSCLDDPEFKYSFKTRIYWTVNKITGWDSPLVRCRACGEPIKRWNILDPARGYKATCCKKCERAVASQANKDTCMRRYGVANVFASEAVRESLRCRKDEIQRKRENTKIQHFGNSAFNNPEKARRTKIARYGDVWHLEKCRESMTAKYGAPNPMQVASIRERQQNPVYALDGVKFDSSWEVYMYIWLKDHGVEFEYHPESPEFWYQKDDGSRHRYYPDFILTEKGEIWEPKGDNSFDEQGRPVKNGWFDWHEKYEYMKSLGVRFFFKKDIEPFREYAEGRYGADFLERIQDGGLKPLSGREAYSARRDAAFSMYEKHGREAFNMFRSYDFPLVFVSEEQARREVKRLMKDQTKDQTPSGLVRAFHPSMFSCRRRGMTSPREYWEAFKDEKSWQDGGWRDFYVNRFTYAETKAAEEFRRTGILRPETILAGFTITHRADCVSYLKPMLAKRLASKYLAGFQEVFCPFSGFSGIMLGVAYGLGKRFVGRDINKTEIFESKKLVEYLAGLGFKAEVDLAVADVFEGEGEYESMFCCPPYSDIEQWNFDGRGECLDRNLPCDDWIDVCLRRYKCRRYLFVVDDRTTVRHREQIVEKLENRSHFGKNDEYVVAIDA